MWELVVRYKWLVKKVQNGRTGNFADQLSETSLESIKVVKALSYLLQCLTDAMDQTREQMNVIKNLMWVHWEEDSISESFYDFHQCFHEFLECLVSLWTVVMSMFRATKIDILYISEGITTQIVSCYQLAVKSIMSCWQGYLAVYNRQNPSDINTAKVKVWLSSSIVGAGFTRALDASHLLLLSMCTDLSWNYGPKQELGHSEVTGVNDDREPKVPTIIFKPHSKQTGESKTGEERRKDEAKCAYEVKRIARRYEYVNYKDSCGKSSEEKKSMAQSLISNESEILSHVCLVVNPSLSESNQERSNSVENDPKQCSEMVSSDHTDHSTTSTSSSSEETANQHVCCCQPSNSKRNGDSEESTLKFSAEDWETISDNLKEFRLDLENLLSTVTLSRLEESIIEKLKYFLDAASVEEVKSRGFSALPLLKLFSDVISSQLSSLQLLEEELPVQIQVWKSNEKNDLFRSHVRGFDPEEALSQAKNLINIHYHAFFALMLLVEAPQIQRFIHYAASLCESFSEAITHASNLVLARVVTDNKIIVAPNFSHKIIVHPYRLSHKHSLVLANAHALCDGLFALLARCSTTFSLDQK